MNRKERIAKLEEKIKRLDVDPLVRHDMIEEVTRLMNEENQNPNIVEVTIRVDISAGCTLDHTCAKCGTTAKSIPWNYDSLDLETGRADGQIFRVRSAIPPKGWEVLRVENRDGPLRPNTIVEVCPGCIRKFLEVT